MNLRDYQKFGTNLAIQHIANFECSKKNRLLLASPPGTGKSYVEISILNRFPSMILISPKEEIIEGLVSKGLDQSRAFTPMKLLNRLRDGFEFKIKPEAILFDEVHHHEAATWKELELYIDTNKYIGLTASPFRGTLKETRSFLEEWGKPVWLIGYRTAFQSGLIHLPSIEIVPMANDDLLEIRSGEFVVNQVDNQYKTKITEILELVKERAYSIPTIISVSSKEFAWFLQETLEDKGLGSSVILAETPVSLRYKIIDQCLYHNIPIIQIQTIGEGVDYHFKQLIDLSPIYSPVKWVQLLGRIFRVPGTYICTNRNLIRHSYILQGAIPEGALKEDLKAFGSYQRAFNRILTLESLGKFKPTEVTLHSGLPVTAYFLESYVEGNVVKFAALYHPQWEEGIYAYKLDQIQIDGSREWGKWKQIAELPEELKGFSSQGRGMVTDKQKQWWDRMANHCGLDPKQPITQKEFQVLPLLKDLGIKLK